MSPAQPILPNEKELFLRMSMGDEAAFTTIFYHYTQRIYHYILNKTKSTEAAEEIVQDVFVKIWSNKEKFSEVSNYESYLFTMASNKVLDWFKKMAFEAKIKRHVWSTIGELSNITIEELDLKHSQELINKAVEQLTPQRRKIFLLNKEDGFSRQEIADQLNLSVNTVNNHLNEAVRQVKEYLEKTPGTSLAMLLFIVQNIPFKG
ncbi:MAG: RNA polymerase sigma-70 factor [Chitinophagaceae bacterium]